MLGEESCSFSLENSIEASRNHVKHEAIVEYEVAWRLLYVKNLQKASFSSH